MHLTIRHITFIPGTYFLLGMWHHYLAHESKVHY